MPEAETAMPDEARSIHIADTPEARACAVAPVLLAEAAAIEASRRITPAALNVLHAQRLFRCLLPASVGGDEVLPADYVRMLIQVARADASTAWCIGQGSGCSMAAAYLPLATARAVWGDDPRAVLAWGQNQGARAVVVDGGYIVTGHWTFVSGGHHATWIGGHCHVVERDGSLRAGPDGRPIERTMLIPRAAMATTDTWDVIGLRGTGSDTFAVADYFVPDGYSTCRDTDAERREPGTLYQFSTTTMYASGFAGVALGVARGLLDRFVEMAGDKTPSLTARALRDSPVIHRDLAIAEARWRAARSHLLATLSDTWDGITGRGTITLDERMNIRLAATFAIREAKEIGDFCWREAGATAIFAAQGFERRFRDLNTVTQQVQGRMTHLETVGQHLLGVTPATLRHI